MKYLGILEFIGEVKIVEGQTLGECKIGINKYIEAIKASYPNGKYRVRYFLTTQVQ